MIGREHSFGTGFAYRAISSGFPLFWVLVRGKSRNSYGTNSNLWVQKKVIKVRQSTQNARHRPAESFWKFSSDSPFNLFKNLGDVLLSHLWIKCVLRQTVSCIFRCFSRKCRQLYLIPQSCHDSEGKDLSVVKTELIFYSITKANVSFYEGKFQRDQTVKDINKWVWYQRLQNYVIIIVLSFLPIILSLAGNIIVYTPDQDKSREKGSLSFSKTCVFIFS